MPEMAKLLAFPTLPGRLGAPTLGHVEAGELASRWLSIPSAARSDSDRQTYLAGAETYFALVKLLYDQQNTAPALVAEEAAELFNSIVKSEGPIGLFDERDYLLGEFALTAGAAFRQLGRRQDTERWLNRAESSFRHTLNPAPKLAEVAYHRLALKYDSRELEDVLELIPSLTSSYLKLGMRREFSKTEFLRAMTLKVSGRQHEASAVFNALANELDANVD